MKIFVVIFFFLTVCIIGQGQDEKFRPQFSTIIVAEKGKEMIAQCSRSVPEGIDGFWDPSEENKADIIVVNGNIEEIVIRNVGGKEPLKGKELKNLKVFLQHYADSIVSKWPGGRCH